VQCIGGSATAGLYNGAMLILAGKSTVISRMMISNNYKVVIGIPNDFKELDAHILLEKEIKSFKKFIATGKKYSQLVAYKMIHNVLPAISVNNLDELGNLIYEYRFKMGSIKNCSYAYNKLPDIAKKLEFLKKEKIADVLSISSVGPAFFVITKKENFCENVFKKNNLKTYIVDLENNKYKVLKRIR
jgi:predicted sugar kinase